MSREINGYPAFPIYGVTVWWVQDGEPGDWDNGRSRNLLPGRKWNTSGYDRMFKEEVGTDEIIKQAIASIKADPKRFPNASSIYCRVVFRRYDTWCLTWFAHFTYEMGLSDADVLASFHEFVRRKERENIQNGHRANWCNYDDPRAGEYYCLMGAEDEWRWKGIDDNKNDTPPPCRCSGCKQNGTIVIGH